MYQNTGPLAGCDEDDVDDNDDDDDIYDGDDDDFAHFTVPANRHAASQHCHSTLWSQHTIID